MPDAPRLRRKGPAPRARIAHIGPGAFFRAFNGVFTQEAMDATGTDWGIVAISLRSPAARDGLSPQGGVYTSVTLREDGQDAKIIGVITEALVAPEEPERVLAAMADPHIAIVSMTMTEKGYCHNPATGRLDLSHPDIAGDLADNAPPVSAPGLIVEALARRSRAGAPAFTVLSCDNLPSNGQLARGVILDFARARDPELASWIEGHVTFPSTMVDRITPATTEEDILRLEATEGYYDGACVFHEAFRQWVIEDDFVAGRPDWDRAGAQFVRDVEAHETMKLRCLNGTHSALAYLGYLAGFETISDAVADPDFKALCEALWAGEILPTVPQPEGEDLPAYCRALMTRYRDRSLRHRTWQIAMDGSQKLPQRILGTIRDTLDAGRDAPGLCLVVAAWMRYVSGLDEFGQPIDVRDPIADRLRAASDSADDAAGKVAALLAIKEVFGEDLAADPRFRQSVVTGYEALLSKGAAGAVRAYLDPPS